ncbi:membrane-associated protein, putative [Bodo saltans]|uniref:Membrane-associated protein, putative n=1 Tax=Bodo saltans TaxID=75058 RepID=A0A0S4JBV3_BODSA|nr:membrane-associated protein, putative [Bodo saltans]|eukprot:CUG88979.1 membrane-associated protein, putative [Bodo saltans]
MPQSVTQLISRSTQTIPSAHGSEAAFHGHHLHRTLLILVLWSPIVSLLNGVALFLYWKPKALAVARLENNNTVDPSYYVFVCALFLHFVISHAFVVQRGVRSMIGQRTYQQRAVEVKHAAMTFVAVTLPLFITHIALSERMKAYAPDEAYEVLDTDSKELGKAAVGFTQVVLWGTPASAVLVAWYWWVLTFSEKLQRGVRMFADREAHAQKNRQNEWHHELATAMEKARQRRHTGTADSLYPQRQTTALFDAMEGPPACAGGVGQASSD